MTRQRLLQEALAYLERVTQMDAPPTRHAWAWFNLGQSRQWLGYPRGEVLVVYQRAVELVPGEDRFRRAVQAAE